MIKVEKQMEAGKYTVLFLDASLPLTNFKKVLIDNKEYTPEIVYDMKDCVGVVAKGDFTGKEIKFI